MFSRFKRCLIVFGIGSAYAAMLEAQITSSARISRPSEQGPSAVVGRVGGSNTRYSGDASTLNSRTRFDYQNNLMGGQGFGIGSGLRGANRSGAMGILSGGSLLGGGPPADAFAHFSRRRAGIVNNELVRGSLGFGAGDVYQASGLEEAISNDIPLIGWESPRVDGGDAPVYIAPSDSSAFHNFFGLRPSTAPLRSQPDSPNALQSELLDKVNTMNVSDLIEKGKQQMKLGTTDGVPDRQEQLARALDTFSSARRIDPKAWLPCLLAMQVALEKERYDSAMFMLSEAVRRNALAIAERPEIELLYGSRILLENQLRGRLKAGAQNPGNAQAAIFEGYAALLLKDRPRASAAVRRIEEINRLESDQSVELIRKALLAALQ